MKGLHTSFMSSIKSGSNPRSVEMDMVTLSEAMQKKLRRKDCPYLHNCGVRVTKDFFTRICNTTIYVNCHHFAKRVNELKTPMSWLQKIAIDQARMVEQSIEVQ